ncbi:histidinol-phosphate aminotransferase [Tritrichomonas foetus]|uniref:Histidinol-phosphate aminotransferase n=1 Tax=Tritrichomonas foetus TaxID=1144522 RepID=A0A1J4JJI4_9EUKA|nr:histidinol-phosphate aminotransferase [Tritrichomonas foetus]|eukprot:OHS98503.1 histidinol-phosphate aminotransferase [Tritrichomonas foetus]
MTQYPTVDPRTKFTKPPLECFHGGQSYRDCPNFQCDFSISTNNSGPPKSAIEAAKAAFSDLEHYPDQDAWVPRCHIAHKWGIDPSEILVGNGASELIDVLMRVFPEGSTWRPGPWPAQYNEYTRAAESAGLINVPFSESSATLTILVNPNTPTGNYLELESDLRNLIARDVSSTFIIDESFLICIGQNWLEHSAMNLIKEFHDRVIVVSSFTKAYACPLLRLGVLVSTKTMIDKIASLQAPWSVNGFAQNFIVEALKDDKYFIDMWETTPGYKKEMIRLSKELGVSPNEEAPIWVPYLMVDCYTEENASHFEKTAFNGGYPVRNCSSFGLPSCIRLSVRPTAQINALFKVLQADTALVSKIKAAHK